MNGEHRELTRDERKTIRKLVVNECANYDKDLGCLPLNCGRCYMLDKCWTGVYCKHFKESVLPLDPALKATLTSDGLDTRPCAVCGRQFVSKTNKQYCGTVCAAFARRKQKRDSIRKKRGGM